jgi:hypothetical protein
MSLLNGDGDREEGSDADTADTATTLGRETFFWRSEVDFCMCNSDVCVDECYSRFCLKVRVNMNTCRKQMGTMGQKIIVCQHLDEEAIPYYSNSDEYSSLLIICKNAFLII